MQWQSLLTSAAAVAGVVAAGCQSAPSVRAADPGQPPPPAQVQPAGLNAAPAPPPGGRSVTAVRALVNGVPILDSEIMDAARSQLAFLRPGTEEEFVAEIKKIKAAVLEQLIERELLVREAEQKLMLAKKKEVLDKVKEEADEQFQQRVKKIRATFKSDEEFNAYLRAQGTSLEEQKRIQRRVTIAQEYLRSNIMRAVERHSGHQDVYDYYRNHPEEFQRIDSVQWQDIFIDAAKYPAREDAYRAAEEVATRARAGDGDEFVRLCEKYDNGLARTKKGAGIGTRREDVSPPEASAVLFQMRDGDVGPIVTVPAGFHVIRLVKRTQAGLAPFDDETQKAIKEKLRNEAYTMESKRFLDELKKNAHIERFTSP
jgi:parvulin-like peptidyl-prolyl isomerase